MKPDARVDAAADAGEEAEESDVGEEAETSTLGDGAAEGEQEGDVVPEASALEPPPPGKGVVRKSTTFVKNVVQDRGKYGRFAERWFSKGGGWNANGRKRQGLSSGETDFASEQEEGKPVVEDNEKKATAGGAELKEEESSTNRPMNEEVQEGGDEEKTREEGAPRKSTNQSVVESLTPRILRSARLYFSTSGFFFSYDYDISGTLMQKSVLTSSLPLWKRFDGSVSLYLFEDGTHY